jgi:hypothetical protein
MMAGEAIKEVAGIGQGWPQPDVRRTSGRLRRQHGCGCSTAHTHQSPTLRWKGCRPQSHAVTSFRNCNFLRVRQHLLALAHVLARASWGLRAPTQWANLRCGQRVFAYPVPRERELAILGRHRYRVGAPAPTADRVTRCLTAVSDPTPGCVCSPSRLRQHRLQCAAV